METKQLKTEKKAVKQQEPIKERVSSPLTNVYVDDNEFYMESELPGVEKDSLEITLENDLLTIHGSRSNQSIDGYELKYAEFDSKHFKRQFKIEGSIDAETIKASIQNGVLRLHIPFKKGKVQQIPVAIQ